MKHLCTASIDAGCSLHPQVTVNVSLLKVAVLVECLLQKCMVLVLVLSQASTDLLEGGRPREGCYLRRMKDVTVSGMDLQSPDRWNDLFLDCLLSLHHWSRLYDSRNIARDRFFLPSGKHYSSLCTT